MKNKRNKNGITLIALVITIIVLLILAGVSLRLVAGDEGILGRAEKAVNKSNTTSLQEEIELAISEARIAYYEGDIVDEATSASENIAKTLEKGIETSQGTVKLEGESLTISGTEIGTYNKNGVTIKVSTKEMTLADVTDANIGEYIDLENNIVGTSATTDDWRIFYKEGDKVYAILADYLPNSTGGYAAAAGLTTSDDEPYSVWSTSQAALLNGLKHTTAWNGLANGISGATVTGAPTYEQLKKSWNSNSKVNSSKMLNEKVGSQNGLSDPTKLYIPHTSLKDVCAGYWLAIDFPSQPEDLCVVYYDGRVADGSYYFDNVAARPLICLPSSVAVGYDQTNQLWTVK